MEEITWSQIETMAKPGDELFGDFIQTSWEKDENGEYVPIEHPTNKLVFWSCITCLTDKPDVRKGAKFFKPRDSKILYWIKKETEHDDKSNISQH